MTCRLLCALAVVSTLALAAAGCADADPPAERSPPGLGAAAPIVTDASAYLVRPLAEDDAPLQRYAFTLVARFANRTDSTVFLARGMPEQPGPDVQVRLLDGGASAYNPAYDAVGHDRQIAVAPGETRTDTFRLVGPSAWDGNTGQVVGALTGRMRLSYTAQACRGDSACPLPDSVALSNPFSVRLARPDGR